MPKPVGKKKSRQFPTIKAQPRKKAAKKRQELTEGQAEHLLAFVDVIRDPVHGDIRLTGLERRILDTQEFQRLRNIAQLGTTQLAYPGATHNRFTHSIGVLHVCSEMIQTCQRNAEIYLRMAGDKDPTPVQLTSTQILLARLCALMHDLTHVPYGHSLVKEGRVFSEDEWESEERIGLLYNEGRSDIYRSFQGCLTEFVFPSSAKIKRITREQAKWLWKTVVHILDVAQDEVHTLGFPFVHDLVCNTICADLIDYVQRDMYNCGLVESVGDRFLKYLAVVPTTCQIEDNKHIVNESSSAFRYKPNAQRSTTGKSATNVKVPVAFATRRHGKRLLSCRLVLLEYRYNERGQVVRKRDVVNEAIDLIRRRFSIADKLYFHRTTAIASGMLACAAYADKLTVEEIWNLSDVEVLKLLEKSGQRQRTSSKTKNRKARNAARASKIAHRLRLRRLFKPIYRVGYKGEQHDNKDSEQLWNDVYPKYLKPEACARFIGILEQLIGLLYCGDPTQGVGAVSIYCPNREMNLKAFGMMVVRDPHVAPVKVERLEDTPYELVKDEIELIKNQHKNLWRLEVAVDPQVVQMHPVDTRTLDLAGVIQHSMSNLTNEVDGFKDPPTQDIILFLAKTYVEFVLKRHSVDPPIPKQDLDSITGGLDCSKQQPLVIIKKIERHLRKMGHIKKG